MHQADVVHSVRWNAKAGSGINNDTPRWYSVAAGDSRRTVRPTGTLGVAWTATMWRLFIHRGGAQAISASYPSHADQLRRGRQRQIWFIPFVDKRVCVNCAAKTVKFFDNECYTFSDVPSLSSELHI